VFRFLLVSLAIGAILGEVTISERKRKLNEMTKGNNLGDVYGTTLERIKAQKGSKSKLGMDALMWISNSERPLEASELCHALGVKIGSTDLDLENIPTIRTLIGCSLGLITVEASSSVVRLVHFTLQEYLSNNPRLFESPQSMMAEVCLTYLNFQYIRKLSPTLRFDPPAVPLVEYASCYWGKHIKREKTERVSPLALKLLIGFEQHISSQLLLLHYCGSGPWWEWRFYERHGPNGFTGLHGAAFLGIAEIVAALLGIKEWDINATDNRGRIALAWTAVRGHEEVARILLQRRDLNPNTPDTEYGQTPLLRAAERGHKGVVKLLLEREDLRPNTPDTEYGRTPLWWASVRGYEGIVRLLLEREDADPNTPDTEYGRTPLWWAAVRGYDGIVRLLLEREDTNPNTPDTEYGRTPLWWAAECGHSGIVRLLLEREDTNPNIPDAKYGQTPLPAAVMGEHEGAVGLLLQRNDLDPNILDTGHGRTPLWWAAECGCDEIVRLLLEREDTNPNTPDAGYGRTPLRRAGERVYDGIVRLLLEREDTNPNIPDTIYGQTPLMWAAMCGHEGIVKLLFERKDLNPKIPDLRGKTALELAMSWGRTGVVQLLSKPKPSLPTPVNTKPAKNMSQKTLPQGTVLNSNNKRTIPPNNEGTLQKKPKASLT